MPKTGRLNFMARLAYAGGRMLLGLAEGLAMGSIDDGLEQRIHNLRCSVAELQQRVQAVEERLGRLEPPSRSRRPHPYNRQATGRDKKGGAWSLAEEIYAAYLQGDDLTELARRYGKNKGEIQLMLNIAKVQRRNAV